MPAAGYQPRSPPATGTASAQCADRDGGTSGPRCPPGLHQVGTTAQGEGCDSAAQRLRARVGASDAELDFAADEWLPWALGDTTRLPVIAFDARAALFDADEIFGVDRDEHTYGELFFARLAGTTINGRSATEIAREIGLGLPDVPPLQLDGRIRATRLVNGGVAFDDVDVAVAARGGTLDVRAASFRMLGGGVQLTGRLGLAASASGDRGAQPLALDYTVNGVGTQQFLQRFTAFRDHIGGEMLLQGSVRPSDRGRERKHSDSASTPFEQVRRRQPR